MDVVVIDARSIAKKWQPLIFVLEFRPRGFEGGKGGSILAASGIVLAPVLIELSQRTLRLPLQEHRTIRGLREFTECILGSCSVALSGRESCLHEQRINQTASIVIRARNGKGLVGVAFGVV